jgi:hypothetical protein
MKLVVSCHWLEPPKSMLLKWHTITALYMGDQHEYLRSALKKVEKQFLNASNAGNRSIALFVGIGAY